MSAKHWHVDNLSSNQNVSSSIFQKNGAATDIFKCSDVIIMTWFIISDHIPDIKIKGANNNLMLVHYSLVFTCISNYSWSTNKVITIISFDVTSKYLESVQGLNQQDLDDFSQTFRYPWLKGCIYVSLLSFSFWDDW